MVILSATPAVPERGAIGSECFDKTFTVPKYTPGGASTVVDKGNTLHEQAFEVSYLGW